jgi:hypothetical protein
MCIVSLYEALERYLKSVSPIRLWNILIEVKLH